MGNGTSPVIIFDFDGTIADSLYATLSVLYGLMHRKPLPPEDISRLRGMTMVQVLRQLKIPVWRALFWRKKVHQAFRDRMDSIAVIPEIDEAIATLAQSHDLYVVSANDAPNMRIFLGRFQLEPYFKGIYGGANPIGKARLLRKVLREHQIDPAHAWYVGDQPWDVTAAHRVGMKAAAVAWGFSNLHILKSRKPEVLAFSPNELAQYIADHERHA